jgi:hypothetical protein
MVLYKITRQDLIPFATYVWKQLDFIALLSYPDFYVSNFFQFV